MSSFKLTPSKYKSLLGGFIFLSFSVYYVYYFFLTNQYILLLFAIKTALISIFFYIRLPSQNIKTPLIESVISYISTFLPLMYRENTTLFSSDTHLIFFSTYLAGHLLSIFSIITLGKSFGLSPQKRELVSSGIYKYVKHPIYTGYVISEFSFTIMNISPRNVSIFLLATSLYFVRSKMEDRILRS